MTPQTLRTIGEALYGSYWQTELARALNIDPRRVRQWLASERSIPAGVQGDLAELCEERGGALTTMAQTLRKTEAP